MKKILLKILAFVCIVCINGNIVFAEEEYNPIKDKEDGLATFDEPTDKKGFNTLGNGDAGGAGKAAERIMGTIIQTIKIVGYGIAIIMLIYVAIKYMSAAPDEKAEFKKSATAYIVGAVVLFGAASIVGIIQNFATTNVK